MCLNMCVCVCVCVCVLCVCVLPERNISSPGTQMHCIPTDNTHGVCERDYALCLLSGWQWIFTWPVKAI